MKKTLLLVFIHGFKGTDHTFEAFPADLRALLGHTLPNIEIVSVQYPRYETRGDLKECVARFKEWLQNKVIDLEIANQTSSPTIDPSVHVVLCGHSMGGIVAAETLLSIVNEEVVPPATNSGINTTDSTNSTTRSDHATNLGVPDDIPRPASAPPVDATRLFFPRIKAIIAFDTPYLGISPGVLAHGAEEQLNHASSAYKAFDSASSFFGWGSSRSGTSSPQPIPDAANRALPSPAGSTGSSTSSVTWNKWGKYAAFGGAAAALAGAAGAAYLTRNQISQGFAWAGSHFEFVSSLARGAELQKRVESVVQLTRTHGVGFADFYTALGTKATSTTATAIAGSRADRTFCVVPRGAGQAAISGAGSGSRSPDSAADLAGLKDEMQEGEQVEEFVRDASKSKGHWVRCVNEAVGDEITAHTAMFTPRKNPGYHSMLPAVRDEIAQWIDRDWYAKATAASTGYAADDGLDDISME